MKKFYSKLRKFVGEKLFGGDVSQILNEIEPYLHSKDKIIDLGAGTCLIAKLLQDKGYTVEAVDVKDASYYPEVKIRIYDGEHLPYKENEFDVCLLRAVLHHTSNPELVLKEAVRVSKRLIIHENIVTNIFQRYYTYLIDCIMNKELIEPHTNKTDKEWRILFKKLGLSLSNTHDKKAYFFMRDKIYFLRKI